MSLRQNTLMLEEKLCFIHLPKNGALPGKQENTWDDTGVTCSASSVQNVIFFFFKYISAYLPFTGQKKHCQVNGVGKTF